MEERIDAVVFDAEDHGMVGIGGGAFEAVNDQFLQAGDIRPLCLELFGDAERFGLPEHFSAIGRGLPLGRAGERLGGLARLFGGSGVFDFGVGQHLSGLAQQGLQPDGVKVDIGDGGKQCFHDEPVDGAIFGAEFARPMHHHRDSLCGIHQQILQQGRFIVLAAYADACASLAARCLFALITEHFVFSFR